MMNNDNTIDVQSKLYGFIALNASKNRFSTTINSRFKSDGLNAMMIPMNIREDDLFFTLSNSKNSKLNGLMIDFEYQNEVIELLTSKSEVVEKSSLCDAVVIKDGNLHGEYLFANALNSMCQALHVKSVAIIGANSYTKAFLLSNSYEVAVFDEYIEDILKLSQETQKDIDINRLSNELHVELSSYDIVLNFSSQDVSMITCSIKNCFELYENELKSVSENYIDRDEFLEYYVDVFYKEIVCS
ncbi:MAG: hypothetical protein U9N42_01085 [Campylobacterota bacterium]|nr:hypothetical protein [Campylobacterota bacterium]